MYGGLILWALSHPPVEYILLAVDYVSKWEEAIPTITCDAKVVLNFI